MRFASFVVMIALLGCGSKDRVASVGDVDLSSADLALAVARTGDQERGLATLVDATLLAEGAGARGIDKDPAVKARADAAAREVIGAALFDKVAADATSSVALRARYEQEKATLARRRVHVAHIVIHDGNESATKLALVLARLHAGDPFATVARELSEDPASAARGGELPQLEEGQSDATFFDACWKLAEGETSDVVKTPFGAHVIRSLAEPTTVTPSFDAVRGKLAAEASQDARKLLLEQLRRDIPVHLQESSAAGSSHL